MSPDVSQAAETLSPNQVVIEARSRWLYIPLRSIWQYRELLYFLVWRDDQVGSWHHGDQSGIEPCQE